MINIMRHIKPLYNKGKILLLFCMTFLGGQNHALAITLKGSVPESQLQMEIDSEGRHIGIIPEFFQAIDKAMGGKTELIFVPFQRSVNNVIEGRVDFHFPMIAVAEEKRNQQSFDYSTVTVTEIPFVLYTNKNNPVDMTRLGQYDIETDSAHTPYFDFKVASSSCGECSVRMVNAGRLDGYIYAQQETDPYLLKHHLTNIKRQLYKVFDVKIILPKGKRGDVVDMYLLEGITKIRKTGEFQRILGPRTLGYDDWQP